MTHRDIDQCYADLPIDLSDEALVRHLVRVAWSVLPTLDPITEADKGAMLLAHSALKDALKAVVPERAGDTVAADGMRRILTKGESQCDNH